MKKRHVIGLKAQMAEFICQSCRAELNKDVALVTSKMQKHQEFLSEKSACVKSNSDDKVTAPKKLQSTSSHAFQSHRSTDIWSNQIPSAALVVFCLNYPTIEHCCKDPIYGFSACFQTLPYTDHVMLATRWQKKKK